jgi:hypothetical protein
VKAKAGNAKPPTKRPTPPPKAAKAKPARKSR